MSQGGMSSHSPPKQSHNIVFSISPKKNPTINIFAPEEEGIHSGTGAIHSG